MSRVLAIAPSELATVRAILAEQLPPGVIVSVFGSRAGGTPKPWSDLDLAFEASAPLPLECLARLTEAFEDSDLPYKVDCVDYAAATPQFRAIIDAGKVPLP